MIRKKEMEKMFMLTRTTFHFVATLFFLLALSWQASAAEIKGKVIQVRDKEVTIRLDSQAPVNIGDKVELSYTVYGEPISLGTWQVSKVKDGSTVEASPVDIEGDPAPNYDAVVHATGTRAQPQAPQENQTVGGEGQSMMDGVDYAASARSYEKACNKGDLNGCASLAGLYRTGLGVAQDYRRANELVERACNGGVSCACVDLAYSYRYGHGVSKDANRSQSLMTKACNEGCQAGCYELMFPPQS